MLLTGLLPDISLPSFQANRVKNPRVTWSNTYGLDGLSVEEHAFMVPLPQDPSTSFSKETKWFQGERYGGQGLASNGGGVRCGIAQNMQIKGIGKNPLAGKTTDFYHSYGGATLNEGVIEALWGEVCHLALPFGGVRVYGLISTGTRVPLRYPKKGGPTTTSRVLIVRQTAVRPAHYMRSVFFLPQGEMLAAPSDAARTRAAILGVGRLFNAIGILPDAAAESPAPTAIRDCLIEIFSRFASQIAAARAKRIMHGSLTASNISMDGRWLDFGSISAVSDYGRIIIPRGAPDFMHDELPLQNSAINLVFYLEKYFPGFKESKVLTAAELWSTFNNFLDQRLEMEFLKLSGITECDLAAIDREIRGRTYAVFKDIVASGNRTPFTILSADNDYIPVMPGKMGDFHLNTLLIESALSRGPGEMEECIRSHLPDAALRHRFINAFWRLKQAHLDGKANKINASLFVSINSIRINAAVPELYRTELYPAIEKLVGAGGNVTNFIERILKNVRTVLTEPIDGKLDLYEWCNRETSVSMEAGIMRDGESISFAEFVSGLATDRSGASLRKKLDRYENQFP